MNDGSNLEIVKRAYAAFAAGDVASVLALLSPQVEWTEAEGSPYGGTYHGPQQVLEAVFARLDADWKTFEVSPAEFVGDGATVVALGTYRASHRATGKGFEAPFAHVWQLGDGKLTRFRQYIDTALMSAAATATAR